MFFLGGSLRAVDSFLVDILVVVTGMAPRDFNFSPKFGVFVFLYRSHLARSVIYS